MWFLLGLQVRPSVEDEPNAAEARNPLQASKLGGFLICVQRVEQEKLVVPMAEHRVGDDLRHDR